jgi:hypothetical protein
LCCLDYPRQRVAEAELPGRYAASIQRCTSTHRPPRRFLELSDRAENGYASVLRAVHDDEWWKAGLKLFGVNAVLNTSAVALITRAWRWASRR